VSKYFFFLQKQPKTPIVSYCSNPYKYKRPVSLNALSIILQFTKYFHSQNCRV